MIARPTQKVHALISPVEEEIQMSGAVAMACVIAILAGTVGFLLGMMVWSIRDEVRGTRYAVWADFGLSIALAILFLSSWGAQAIAQWQEFTDEQATHQQEASLGDFAATFASSTLENWQSEFLQLFSFVVLSAMLIHRGSAESRDSDDRMEESLARIEKALGTSPEKAVAAPSTGERVERVHERLADQTTGDDQDEQ